MRSKRLLDYVNNVNYASLPKSIVKFTRLSILDTIGATLDGVKMLSDSRQPIYLSKLERNIKIKEGTIIGTRYKTTAELAFRNNACSCSLYDQDGLPVPSQTYPGRQVILAALAAAEKLNASIQDTIVVMIIANELILRTGRAVLEIGWPPGSMYPSERLSPYCFTVPGVASIVLKLINPGPEKGGSNGDCINKTTSSQSASDTTNFTEENVPPLLLTETFRLLQTGTSVGYFPIKISDTSIITEIAEKIADSRQLTYRLGRKYLLVSQGYKPALANRYFHHPLAAVKLALKNERLKISLIQSLTLSGLSSMLKLLTKCSLEDARHLMAIFLTFIGEAVDPEVAFTLSGSFNRDSIDQLKAKINFKEDDQAWEDLVLSESEDFPFSAKIHLYPGFSKQARLVGEIHEIENVLTEKRVSDYFEYRTDVIGDDSGQQLLHRLMSNDDFAVSAVMSLTSPTRWHRVKTLFSNMLRSRPGD
jgi:hypothetical protein